MVRLLAVTLGTLASAQQDETFADIAARIRAGGWFEQPVWRRGDDGQLQLHYIADAGGSVQGMRFQPLLGDELRRGLQGAGAIGYLALFCHGDGDLLGMTDAELHFGALGMGTSDEELRHFLALPMATTVGQMRRAEVLDRMLAIDRLQRRRCKAAAPELRVLIRDDLDPALTARARLALAALENQPRTPRRLDPEQLALPLTFDAAIVVDHTRLPDLSWMTGLGRRLGALVTAQTMAQFPGTSNPAISNGAQTMCDVVGELPFGVAHRYGNARIDHSCLVITAQNDARMPVALSWQAAGDFEHERWRGAALPEGTMPDNPLLSGTMQIGATHLAATVGGSAGKPRPAQAAGLLEDVGLAVRVVIPPTSKLWASLAFLDLPPAKGAELRLSCGDAAHGQPAVLVLMVQARDEDAAEAWTQRGTQLLAAARELLERELPPAAREHADARRVLAALLGAALSTKEDAAFATVELQGITPAVVRTIAESFFAD